MPVREIIVTEIYFAVTCWLPERGTACIPHGFGSFAGIIDARELIVANFTITSDFYRLFETVRIPLVVTDCELTLIYANQFAHEVLPLKLESGKRLDVEEFLQPEDSTGFDTVVSECKEQGEGIGTLKQKDIDKYFKVKAYYLQGTSSEIIFHFDDVSQVRVLESQFYDHLVDLYNQLETKEREITRLKSRVFQSKELSTE